MRGYLKGASVIRQCVRCFSIRFTGDEGECKTCRAVLDVATTECQLLPFCDLSTDESPVGDLPVGIMADGVVNRA